MWSLLHLVAAGDKQKSSHHHLILGLEDSEVSAAPSLDQPLPAKDPTSVASKPASADQEVSPHVAVSLANSSNASCSHMRMISN